MAYKRVTDKNGNVFTIDFFEIIDKDTDTTGYCIDGECWAYGYRRSKVYYRPERTWDDHCGNTPCGYYVIVKLPTTGERKRVYMF